MVRPQSNLAPPSQPWGRDIESQLDQIAIEAKMSKEANDANNKASAATLGTISKQIADIAQTQAAMVAQQTTLAAQQAALTSAVADITALSANQVSGSTGTASGSPTLNSTPTGYAAITFTVPAGFTKANVMGVSEISAGGTVASVIHTQIAGSNGPDMYAFTNAAYANSGCSYARSLTGLTPGSTFTVQTVANTTAGTTSSVLVTSASVIWLK